ncbi:hypothetical protein ACU4GD_28365 [Cupriavidus basilensis]
MTVTLVGADGFRGFAHDAGVIGNFVLDGVGDQLARVVRLVRSISRQPTR